MKVGIIMGSKSDLDTMKKASAVLDEFNIPYEMVIASTMAVDGAKNGALFAVQIGAAFNKELKDRYVQYRKDMAKKVLADNAELQGAIKL